MSRPREKTTADLDAIRATLAGFRNGLKVAGVLLDQLPSGSRSTLERVIALLETQAIVVGELEERVFLLEHQVTQVAAGIEETLRVLG